MSEDRLFDLLAIFVLIVLPFAFASFGLALAVRSTSFLCSIVGYAIAVGGTWISLVAGVAVAQCPSQDGELCGERSGLHGDARVELLAVLALTYALAVTGWRSRKPL